MAALVLRTTYGSPLSITQMDSNLTSINGNCAALTPVTIATNLLGGTGVSSSNNLGQIIEINAAVACTMPQASTAINGSIIQFVSTVNGATVTRYGTDTFLAGSTSLNTFTLNIGDSLELVCNGSNQWVAASGTVVFPYSTAASTLVNGLQNIPVGGNTNVTLTAIQNVAQIMQLTGVLTGNIQVIVATVNKTFTVWNNTSGAYSITVKTAGGSGIVVNQGKTQELICEGTNVLIASNDLLGAGIASLAGNTFSGAQNDAPMGTLSSASTVNIGAATTNYINITGTAGITAFDTIASGAVRTLKFSGALTLTNSANLILPSAANITTAAGDVMEVVSLGAGVWSTNYYTRASGTALLRTGAGTWSYTNTNLTVANGSATEVDTSAGAVSITLPATPTVGMSVRLCDYLGTFTLNNLTVIYSGVGIMGFAQNMTVGVNFISFELTYIDSTIGWKLT